MNILFLYGMQLLEFRAEPIAWFDPSQNRYVSTATNGLLLQ